VPELELLENNDVPPFGGKGMRRRETGDPGADHGDFGVAAHAASARGS
jgi:hypothetical protein